MSDERELPRECREALAREHNAFSHDYIKDEKRCPRCQFLKRIDAHLAAGRGEGWVSVGERLPDDFKSVLAQARAAVRDAADGVGIDREGDTHDWEVTHADAVRAARGTK